MGIVYKARQKSLDRIVALKMLLFGPQASPEFAKRFRAEAVLAASLQHPNIVAIHEVGAHEGQQFFVMDYVAGPSLAHLVGHEPLPARRAAGYLKTVAEAIHYAHERGILHRDLKPSNVLIDANDQPRVTDFGLARRFKGDSQVTLTGQVLGSPNYIPPEQALGKRGKVSRQSDVYALGAMLYHLLTGRPPFQGETLTDTLHQALNTEPLTPRLLNPSIPGELETICLKCLEKEPGRRYPTAQALADDLGRFLAGEPILARPVNLLGKTWKWCRRRPALASLAAALALTFLMGVTGILWELKRARAGEMLALRHAYAGDMTIAQQALKEGSLDRALELLNKYRPGRSTPSTLKLWPANDLRGWEWRYLWSLCREDAHSKLTQHSNALVGVAFSPNGKLLAVRHKSGIIDLWDWTARRKTGELFNRGEKNAMALSPQGDFMISGDSDTNGNHSINLWDVANQRLVSSLPQPSKVTALALSPDGTLLAAYFADPKCRILRLPSGEIVKDLPASEFINGDTRVPLFSPDGVTLALGEWGGTIRLMNWRTGQERGIPAPSPDSAGVTALAFSPDGRILASGYGYSDGIIRLWDVASLDPLGRLEGHRGWVAKLVFSPDGRTLFSASDDETVRAWAIQQKRETRRFQGHTSGLRGLAVSLDGRILVSCGNDGSVRVWDAFGKPRPRAHQVLPFPVVNCGAPFTADSRRLFTASLTNPVTVWDVATASAVQRIPALGTNNFSLALSPDERLLAIGGYDGMIKVWDIQNERLVKQFRPHQIPVYGLLFFDQGKTLVSFAMLTHRKVEVKRWDVASWQSISFGPIDVDWAIGLAQSPDRRLLAVGYTGKPSPRLWDWASGELKRVLVSGAGGSWQPVFSADGRLLACPVGGEARVWDTSSWRKVAALKVHASSVVSVAFSPDGKRLVTGGSVGGQLQPALQVWDYVGQRELIGLDAGGNWTMWTRFSPDGNTLAALSWDGVAELWHAPSWAEIEAAEKGQVAP